MEMRLRFTALVGMLALAIGFALPPDAHALTSYNVACSVAALRAAIMSANTDGDDSVLNLTAGCDYLITDAPDAFDDGGNNGLPTVANDGSFTLNANRATVRRDSTLICNIDDADTNDEFRMFAVADEATVIVNDLIARDFCSSEDGGVIEGLEDMHLTVNDCLFESNTADCDGGVLETWAGTFVINSTTFRDNLAGCQGGAAEGTFPTFIVEDSLFEGNRSRSDGGVMRGAKPTYRILNSTFRDNEAGLNGFGDSGALHSSGGPEYVIVGCTFESNRAASDGGAMRVTSSDNVNILNSTFVGNRAGTDGSGDSGAIEVSSSSATLSITNSTFVDNADANGFAFEFDSTDPTVVLKNTIIINTGDICSATTAFDAGGDNLLSDATCDPPADPDFNLGNVTGLAAALADNGGPTETVALLPGSNAIDAVTDCTAVSSGVNPFFSDGDPVTTDQRGVARPQLARCDIGAYEFQPTRPAPVMGYGPLALLLVLLLCAGVLRLRRSSHA